MDAGVRNQLTGTIKAIKSDEVMSQVTLTVGGFFVGSLYWYSYLKKND